MNKKTLCRIALFCAVVLAVATRWLGKNLPYELYENSAGRGG